MPGIADTNRVALRYVPEVTWATTPATPAMQVLRYTGHTIKHNKSQVSSTEIRADRQVPSIVETGVAVDGDVNIEWSNKTFDDFILAVICATGWTNVKLPADTSTVATQTGGLTTIDTAGNLIGAGALVGDWVFIANAGFNAGNPMAFKITALTTSSVTVEDPGAIIVLTGSSDFSYRFAVNGVAKPSFTFEEQFTDLTNAYVLFTGMRADKLTLNLNAQKIIDGSFSFFGKQGITGSAAIVGETLTPPTNTPSCSASADVGALVINGAIAAAGMTKVQLMINNNMRHRPIVGSKYDDDHGYGKINVSVALTALVPDLTLFQESIDHSNVSIDIPIEDQLGFGTIFQIGAMKITGNPTVPGENQDVTLDITGDAYLDPSTGKSTSGNTIRVISYVLPV